MWSDFILQSEEQEHIFNHLGYMYFLGMHNSIIKCSISQLRLQSYISASV